MLNPNLAAPPLKGPLYPRVISSAARTGCPGAIRKSRSTGMQTQNHEFVLFIFSLLFKVNRK
jgi:hypothetical protein